MYNNKACRRLLPCVISLTDRAVCCTTARWSQQVLRTEGTLSYLDSAHDLSGLMPAVRPLNLFDRKNAVPTRDCLRYVIRLTHLSLRVIAQDTAFLFPSRLQFDRAISLRPPCMLYCFWIMVSTILTGTRLLRGTNCVLASRTWQSKTTDWDEIFRVRASLKSDHCSEHHWTKCVTR